LLFAWETLLPTIGAFPVTWHMRAIGHLFQTVLRLETRIETTDSIYFVDYSLTP
jgi:hypothetical protein